MRRILLLSLILAAILILAACTTGDVIRCTAGSGGGMAGLFTGDAQSCQCTSTKDLSEIDYSFDSGKKTCTANTKEVEE